MVISTTGMNLHLNLHLHLHPHPHPHACKFASINNINARKMYRLKTCNDYIFFKYQTTKISCSPMICATNNKPTTKCPLLPGHACISVKLTIFWRYKMLVHQFHENLQWSVLQVVTLNKKQQ